MKLNSSLNKYILRFQSLIAIIVPDAEVKEAWAKKMKWRETWNSFVKMRLVNLQKGWGVPRVGGCSLKYKWKRPVILSPGLPCKLKLNQPQVNMVVTSWMGSNASNFFVIDFLQISLIYCLFIYLFMYFFFSFSFVWFFCGFPYLKDDLIFHFFRTPSSLMFNGNRT